MSLKIEMLSVCISLKQSIRIDSAYALSCGPHNHNGFSPTSARSQPFNPTFNAFLVGCFFFLLFTRPGAAEDNRHPIPSQEQQEEIRKLIRDAYVAPEGDQLLKDALDNTNLDQQYVLLNEAGRLFIDELDVNSALKTAKILSQRFAKDRLAIQYKIIKAISKKSRKKRGAHDVQQFIEDSAFDC